LLTTQGEPLTETELYNSFASLLMPGNDEDIDDMIPGEITSDDFIEKILGFEDVMDENMERDYEIVEVDNDYDNEFS